MPQQAGLTACCDMLTAFVMLCARGRATPGHHRNSLHFIYVQPHTAVGETATRHVLKLYFPVQQKERMFKKESLIKSKKRITWEVYHVFSLIKIPDKVELKNLKIRISPNFTASYKTLFYALYPLFIPALIEVLAQMPIGQRGPTFLQLNQETAVSTSRELCSRARTLDHMVLIYS